MGMRSALHVALMIGVVGLSPPAMTRGQEAAGRREGTPTNRPAAEESRPSTVPSASQDAKPTGSAEATRSLRIPRQVPSTSKGKRWAVVVGIQYTKEERAGWKDRGYIPPLKNAEKDAADVAQILKEKYGYPEGSTILLKGKEATRDAISNLLLEGLFCDDQKVGPDDSVLFYFSGHGVGPEEGASAEEHAYLLPCDAAVNEQGRPNTTFTIDIGAIAAKLRKETECKARHVLLILDCCHSGAVFQMQGVAGGTYEHNGVDDSLLRTRSVQAITSSRATQKASDGTEGNSPFTGSLLRALREVPPSLPRERFSFTTNQLFFAMRAYLSSPTSIEQSPLCRWLDGINAGEFAFYPDPNARFDEISDESRRLLLTMVPSTFGNWWAEEMPWFMPGLRLEILENRSETKSTLADEVDKTKLREAAMLTLKRLKSSPNLDEPRRRRLKHLQMMLDVERAVDRRGQYQEVIDNLKAATAAPPSGGQTTAKDAADPEAVDMHYLAVLQDLTGDHNAAEKTFVRALELYEKESKQFVRMQALEALCLSDYGMLQLAGLNDYDAAYEQFHKARGLFGIGSPVPFRVFCLTKEADACRAKGFTGASDTRMDEALALAKTFDPDEIHPLTAATYKHYAWAKMEQWRFDQAEQRFKKTQEILSKKANRDRPECQIDQLHAKHGLAMIHRFRGEDDDATRAYGELTREISEEISRLERKSEEAINLAEVRALLYDRLVNSLERRADCYLFGRGQDPEAAAFYYRRAVQMVGQVPGNRKVAIETDLLYRQAIALLLPCLNSTDGPDPASDQAVLTFLKKQAQHLLGRAEALYSAFEEPPIKLQLSREIAASLSRGAGVDSPRPAAAASPPAAKDGERAGQHPAAPEVGLAALLENLRNSKRNFNRDELERLMFAYRLLLRQVDEKLDDFKRLELAERLHEHCRSALRMSGSDPGVLTYLRPYFDAVFQAKLKYQPVGTKELIELVWEATTGQLSPPPVDNQPVLAMYFLNDRCHLLLDVPHGRSGRFEVDPDELCSVDALKQASEAGRIFTCPDALRKGLRAIKLLKGQKLLVHFRDPVHEIGSPEPIAPERTRSAMKPVSGTALAPATTTFNFPFDVRSALADPSYEIGLIEVVEDLGKPRASARHSGVLMEGTPSVSRGP